ncbi:hypothetical protein CEXT_291271 [Caerostris extrusa]|uniref:Uncharacterized protein n=1 Tax=Caerostris extrusa TaxID=172846 RepID=A0AAV4N0A9_CAEEX|nr:hypothetical protein CEXT_291271 [Caerostris extrusa]
MLSPSSRDGRGAKEIQSPGLRRLHGRAGAQEDEIGMKRFSTAFRTTGQHSTVSCRCTHRLFARILAYFPASLLTGGPFGGEHNMVIESRRNM